LFYINKKIDFLDLEKIKNLSPIEFIDILKKYNTNTIIVGEDFRFGKNRSGDINLLKKYFNVEIVNEIKIDNIGVHSKIIREFIKKGEIKKANEFLGRNYKIRGYQIKGQGLGSKELLPTVNIELLKPYILPQGVFITLTNSLPSITFIGKRSTDNNFSIETHFLSKIKEKKIFEIEFLDFLRENKKFNNLKKLKEQILLDKQKAINLFQQLL